MLVSRRPLIPVCKGHTLHTTAQVADCNQKRSRASLQNGMHRRFLTPPTHTTPVSPHVCTHPHQPRTCQEVCSHKLRPCACQGNPTRRCQEVLCPEHAYYFNVSHTQHPKLKDGTWSAVRAKAAEQTHCTLALPTDSSCCLSNTQASGTREPAATIGVRICIHTDAHSCQGYGSQRPSARFRGRPTFHSMLRRAKLHKCCGSRTSVNTHSPQHSPSQDVIDKLRQEAVRLPAPCNLHRHTETLASKHQA